jgi:hypothetical protein
MKIVEDELGKEVVSGTRYLDNLVWVIALMLQYVNIPGQHRKNILRTQTRRHR